jgi:nucleoside phosphorylase
VAIVCPLQKERKAVCTALGLKDANRITRHHQNYWLGQIEQSGWSERAYEVVVAQLADMGNVAAALTTAQTIADWHPRAMFVVGIAAGVGEVALGDVIIGSAVFYYERGKATPLGTKPEPYMYPADALLFRKAMTTGTWKSKIHASRPDGTSTRPMLRYGVIASGEKVVADKAMRDEISKRHRKMAGIGMEEYGVAAATWQHEQLVRQITIRGVSDVGDKNKSDEWQEYAAASAASFARHFILERPL